MAAPATPTVPARDPWRSRMGAALAGLRPRWSTASAYRALRATLVIPGLFAITDQVVGNLQMATFTAFGGFATLVMASFGGGRRDKLVAHGFLAVTGTALIVIGTAVSSSTALAAAVTVVVVFVVLFTGAVGPNAATGATAALLAYVLPAASPGTLGMIPTRLAGWWLASIAGTLAVLVVAPQPAVDRLRSRAARSAAVLAEQVDALRCGVAGASIAHAAAEAKHSLVAAFTAAPYRPTGLAVTDQALARVVESLEWTSTLLGDAAQEAPDVAFTRPLDRQLLGRAAAALRDAARLLGDGDVQVPAGNSDRAPAVPALAAPVGASPVAAHAVAQADGSPSNGPGSADAPDAPGAVHVSFHARMIGTAAGSVAVDAAIAARRVGPGVAAAERARWQWQGAGGGRPSVLLDGARRLVRGNASLRSVWFLNSARGAFALAGAVAVADLSNVQHGFWVVLGALSVLRTNAASTGATAMRALAGTVAGFFVGAGLILAIGTHPAALWAALPVAVAVAAYTPGAAPFVVGQAAFTVLVSVLFNILVPVGWAVGALRVEDVALGAGVSAVVGLLFWPRGAMAVVSDDLADGFRRGGLYLVQATSWALGLRALAPDAGARAVQSGVRLDDALRAMSAEQGAQRVPRDQLRRLVGGTLRLRLTAQSLAAMAPPTGALGPAAHELVDDAVALGRECDLLAGRLGRTPEEGPCPSAGRFDDAAPQRGHQQERTLWVGQHLDHVRTSLADMAEPAAAVGARRATPWWR